MAHMLQGAVGQVRPIKRGRRQLVEKRMADPARHETEVAALQALAGCGLPVPEVVDVAPGLIVMTMVPGERIDGLEPLRQINGLAASVELLHVLHDLPLPNGLGQGPDDESIIRAYRASAGPPLPLTVPPARPPVFCHGDWTGGNLLLTGAAVTGIVDWEAAHVGDPLRELSRAAWGASLNDSRQCEAMIDAYGADRDEVMAWSPIHAAELRLWFSRAGPPEYLQALTRRLAAWPS